LCSYYVKFIHVAFAAEFFRKLPAVNSRHYGPLYINTLLMQKIAVEKIGTFRGHRDCVYRLEKAEQPHRFFSAAGDGMVVYWDLTQPDQGELFAQIPASVYALHYRKEHQQLWVGQNFSGLHIIDLHTRREIKSVQLTSSAIFAITGHATVVLVATGEGSVVVLDADTFEVRQRLNVSGKSARSISVNPLGNEFAVGYSDNHIRIFDLDTFALKHTIAAHKNSVFTVQYSPDYRFLLSGSRDAHLKIWNAGADYALQESIVAHMYAINHIAYRPDGAHFLTASMDKSIKVWDARTFRLLKVIDRARHAGHGTSVNTLLWTEYQDQIVSGSDDRTLSVWKLHEVNPADREGTEVGS
jgi:WD40 repeat protein